MLARRFGVRVRRTTARRLRRGMVVCAACRPGWGGVIGLPVRSRYFCVWVLLGGGNDVCVQQWIYCTTTINIILQ